MQRSKFFAIIAVLLMLVAVRFIDTHISGSENEKEFIWRYKLTVEIDTPEGIKSGSSVRQITMIFAPTHDLDRDDPQYSVGHEMAGEAVVIDLGTRGKVFAIQEYEDYKLMHKVFGGDSPSTIEGAKIFSNLKSSQTLPPKLYPKFVRFSDEGNPMSVELVYGDMPSHSGNNSSVKTEDNFEKIYGSGVKLKSITIEMTDDPVTNKINRYLPWLDKYKDQLLDGQRIHTINSDNKLANSLSAGSFTTQLGNRHTQ